MTGPRHAPRAKGHRARAAIVLALTAGAFSVGAYPAAADCCMGAVSQPAAFHARATSGGAVALRPVTAIEVSSEAPADYTARVEIQVGQHIVARTTRHGHSTARWSTLRIPLTRRQRHTIISTAHREGRRAVLGVQLRGTLAGHSHPDVHYVLLVMSGPGMPSATTLPDAGSDQRTRISLAYAVVRGAPQHLRGRIVIRTPRATFTRTNRDASQSAHFTVAVTRACRAEVLVYPAASATRLDATAQLTRSLRGARLLAAGRASDRSPWAVGEFDLLSEDTGQPTGQVRVTGVRLIRLAPQRWLRVSEYVTFSPDCAATDARDDAFVGALGRLMSRAHAEATINRVR